MKTITEAISKQSSNRRLADFLFILWAGGAALLSYSLVYALRKPFTAATFDGIEAFGFDYKVLVTIIQIAGYLIAKFIGIKLISELKRENRLKFILVSIAVAELSLVAFGALPTPYNMFAMFFNGLPEMPIRNVTVKNVIISDAKEGVVISQAEGVVLENIRIETKGHTLNVKNAKNLNIDGKTYSAIGVEGKVMNFK